MSYSRFNKNNIFKLRFQAEAKWHKGKNKRRHEGHPLRNHLFPSWNAYDANVSPKESDLGMFFLDTMFTA